jgi:hypothetical protein
MGSHTQTSPNPESNSNYILFRYIYGKTISLPPCIKITIQTTLAASYSLHYGACEITLCVLAKPDET